MNFLSKNNEILILFFLVIIGYIQFFFGGSFFVHQDQAFISNFSYGNFLGNGWRPDKGLGYSAFYGDSSWHPWSFYSFFENLINDKNNKNISEISYGLSIIFISLLSVFSTYIFFKRINLNLNKYFILLIPLIIFSSGLHGSHYLRIASYSIGIPLSLLVFNNLFTYSFNIYKYCRLIIFFSIILFVTFLLGRIDCVGVILSTTFIYTISNIIYQKLKILKICKLIIPFYIFSFLIFIFLSSFIFYSSIIEIFNGEYVRSKIFDYGISINDLFPKLFSFNSHSLLNYIIGLIQVEWFPRSVGVGKSPIIPLSIRYAYNITPIFPLIFLFFIYHKSKNQWEFFFKFYICIFLIHNFLLIFPIYNNIYYFLQSKSKLLFFFNLQSYLAQLGMLIIFFNNENFNKIKNFFFSKKNLVSYFIIFLFIFYFSLFLLTLVNIFNTNLIINIFYVLLDNFYFEELFKFKKIYLQSVLVNILPYWLQAFDYIYLIFCILNVLLILPFVNYKIFKYYYYKNIFYFVIIINSIFLSFSVYSLSFKELAWQNFDSSRAYNTYDRFYLINEKNINSNYDDKNLNYLNKINKYSNGVNYYNTFYGNYGWELSPFFNLHGHRSFISKMEYDYFLEIFDKKDISLRNISNIPFKESKLLDIASVKYIYSKNNLNRVPKNYNFVEKLENGISIYENNNAFPYFYIAKKIRLLKNLSDLNDINTGEVFLEKNPKLINYTLDSSYPNIELVDFKYGYFEFNFSSNKNELLVISDLWHPFWKAKNKEILLDIVKANGIFKGVILPKGEYSFKVFFDTSDYNIGIYISILTFLFIIFIITLLTKFINEL